MNNVILIGAEDVARAGSSMRQAADNMQRAASTIDSAAERLILALDRVAQQVTDAAERIEAAMASASNVTGKSEQAFFAVGGREACPCPNSCSLHMKCLGNCTAVKR